MLNKNVRGPIALLVLTLALAACSKGSDGSATGKEPASMPATPTIGKPGEPVELLFLGSTDKERFMREHGNDLLKKYPNLKLEYYLLGSTDDEAKGIMSIQGALTKGLSIDILHVGTININPYLIETKLAYDVGELIKKYRYDLNMLYPEALDVVRLITGGPLYGLPVNFSSYKLYYNKDLFDKFGTAYPKDGMTYDEFYELAKKMTRTDGGVQYQGAVINTGNMLLFNQLSAPFVDPKTSKSLFTSDPRWQKFMSNYVRFLQIPGNEKPTDTNLFLKQGTAAMMLAAVDLNASWEINWDIARAPVFADLPGVGGGIQGSIYSLASTSKHKDEAFQVISFLASKEHLMELSKAGILTVLNDPEAKKIFGTEIPWLKNRKINLAAMFPDKYAPPYVLTPYDGLAQSALNKQFGEAAAGKVTDVNTMLRNAEEETNKAVAERLAGKK
ncbi:MAG: extracellular solute-binding protein family 1 [Paenibacillus sp.]|jgi:multiple sugar transport system substrate-binding protein|nr:extracellular solute-binding protein family 1 [Paenibacillus sp.]